MKGYLESLIDPGVFLCVLCEAVGERPPHSLAYPEEGVNGKESEATMLNFNGERNYPGLLETC